MCKHTSLLRIRFIASGDLNARSRSAEVDFLRTSRLLFLRSSKKRIRISHLELRRNSRRTYRNRTEQRCASAILVKSIFQVLSCTKRRVLESVGLCTLRYHPVSTLHVGSKLTLTRSLRRARGRALCGTKQQERD